jgi:hypothetical protein
MFAEYLRLIFIGEDSPVTFEYLSRVGIIILSGIFLVLLGFKIKGTWGAVIALLFGTAVYLFVNDILHF